MEEWKVMFKNIMSLCLCISLITMFTYADSYHSYEDITEEKKSARIEAVSKLETLDIVRDADERWDKSDYITRRDMFKMLHIVKGYVYGEKLYRKYICHSDSNKSYFPFENSVEIKNYFEWAKDDTSVKINIFDFVDLEPYSDDFYFAYSLAYLHLMNGIERDSGKLVEFDREATIGEAIVSICRLFCNPTQKYFTFNPYSTEDIYFYSDMKSYFEYAQKLNLINSDTMFDVMTLNVKYEEINEKIGAYDFMCLLYRALYVSFPASMDSWNSYAMFHYIDLINSSVFYDPSLVTIPKETEAIIN